MTPSQTRQPLLVATIALMAVSTACGVSNEGLGSPPDGATSGSGGARCPARITDLASWPANNTDQSCTRTCGPDNLGEQTCVRSDRSSCQSKTGCVCLEAPCVQCGDCEFMTPPLDTCYLPTNGPEAPPCADDVKKGTSCAPACDRRLCKRKDGKTACLCNPQGEYACGDWGESGWK